MPLDHHVPSGIVTPLRRPPGRDVMTPESWLAWAPVATRYGALAGILYETVFEGVDRPALLALFGAMLGMNEIASAARQTRRDKEPTDDT